MLNINRYGIVFKKIPCTMQFHSVGEFVNIYVIDDTKASKFLRHPKRYGELEQMYQEEFYDIDYQFNNEANEIATAFSDPLFQPANFNHEVIILRNEKKTVVFDGFCKYEVDLPKDFFQEKELIGSYTNFIHEYKLKNPKVFNYN